MKRLKRLFKSKGFTLTECLVAMGVFAIMAAIVMQILGIAILKQKNNHLTEVDMDTQIKGIVLENSLVDRGTVDLAMKFVNDSGNLAGTMSVGDVEVLRYDGDNPNQLELNTMKKNFGIGGGGEDPDEEEGPGMVNGSIHVYGTSGIDTVYVHEVSNTYDDVKDTHTILLNLQLYTADKVLCNTESCSIKVALPSGSKNIVVTPDPKMTYAILSGTVVRFNDKNIADKGDSKKNYEMNISLTLTKDKYESSYKSFAKYFISPDNDSPVISQTFDDSGANGIYNTIHTV